MADLDLCYRSAVDLAAAIREEVADLDRGRS
jgi:hypothetical protein